MLRRAGSHSNVPKGRCRPIPCAGCLFLERPHPLRGPIAPLRLKPADRASRYCSAATGPPPAGGYSNKLRRINELDGRDAILT
jgi:hypothetical protein